MTQPSSTQKIYQDPTRSIQERVEDLLGQMSLDEKLAQLGSIAIYELIEENDYSEGKAPQHLSAGIGQITRLGGYSLMDPTQRARAANQIQAFLTGHTRLGIPAIVHEECCAGYVALEATRFPQMIGLASTWEPELAGQMGSVIRQQMRASGTHQGLSPVLDILRDPRWGRCEETFGEDPILVSQMGAAVVRGLQGPDRKTGILATGKHFAAHSAPEGGMNCAPVHMGQQEFRDLYLLPFETVIRQAGLASIMNSYSELDGEVVAASRAILTDLLRGELGFDGIVVSDYLAIPMIHTHHHMASDLSQAAALALKAGIDIELPHTACYAGPLAQALRDGLVAMEDVDTAVRRVLAQKFELGLFENPFVAEHQASLAYHTPDQSALARRIAEDSLVLLKNQDSLLPFSDEIRTIAVIGPNANSGRNLLGDYSYASMVDIMMDLSPVARQVYASQNYQDLLGQANAEIQTIYAAIQQQAGAGRRVLPYEPGCEVNSDDRSGFARAVAAAQAADAVIMVMGDKSGLNPDCTSGEFRDRAELGLPGVQEELVQAIVDTGKPVVVVLVAGRILSIPRLAESVPAILLAWLPGEEGGPAVAGAIFGSVNPGGKLPVTLPRSVGQVPIYYNHKPTGGHSHLRGDYVNLPSSPLYPFGHGLSYTQFQYQDLTIGPVHLDGTEEISIGLRVTNSGPRAGSEVVQLYIRDEYASSPRPVKELKGFSRLFLQPGETRRVTFHLPVAMLAFVNTRLELVIEPGVFQIMLGSSSEDIRLQGQFTLEGAVRHSGPNRIVVCPVEVG